MSATSTTTRALVLGAGRVGHAIARDLAATPGWAVTSSDVSSSNLERLQGFPDIDTVQADLAQPDTVKELAREVDIVVGAMPSYLGFQTLQAVLESGRDFVDISFFEEDPLVLQSLAIEHDCTAVVDCGVAPGCDNLILGRMLETMDRVDHFVCYVGGLPLERALPWEYKAPFAPNDVLNEYLRPARWRRQGKTVVSEPLTEVEPVEIPGIGTLEAFLTDGLRSLLTTVDVPDMQEKTLRYPGHAAKVLLLKESGLLSADPIRVGEVEVSPLEVTSQRLLPKWELRPDEPEFTALRVVVEGTHQGQTERRTFDLLDFRDPDTGFSSMARTTGFTCAAMARAVASGTFRQSGLFAPEQVGRDRATYDAVFGDLAARGIELNEAIERPAIG